MEDQTICEALPVAEPEDLGSCTCWDDQRIWVAVPVGGPDVLDSCVCWWIRRGNLIAVPVGSLERGSGSCTCWWSRGGGKLVASPVGGA